MQFIIDAHCHIYPEAIAEKAAASTAKFYDGLPAECNGTVETLLSVGKTVGIGHFVVQSVSTKWEQVGSINHFIAQKVGEYPSKLTGLATLHPDSPNPEDDIKEAIALGLHGVKLHPDIQRFAMDGAGGMQLFELCNHYKLPVLVHTGDNRFDFSNPSQVEPVLKAFPELTMVGAHFGGFSVWDEAAEKLTKYENYVVDSSSSMYAMDDAYVMKLINNWGEDRVMFATDYPMWNPIGQWERYANLPLTPVQREKIDHQNAMRIFGISQEILPKGD